MAQTLAGLRAKALLVWWEAAPISTDCPADWQWPDDGGATYSLFCAVAEWTGLKAMVDHYEDEFALAAEKIERAYRDSGRTIAA